MGEDAPCEDAWPHTRRELGGGEGGGGSSVAVDFDVHLDPNRRASGVCVCALGLKRSKRGGYAERCVAVQAFLPASETHRPRARPSPQVERERALPGEKCADTLPTPKKKTRPLF